jgi:membrane-associated protein
MNISFLNPEIIIPAVGTFGVIAIIFLETGLFFGFFFPGDSLLFTAGLLATQGYASFPILLIGTLIAAIVGDTVGYSFGRKMGPTIFKRENSVFFDRSHIEKAQKFYEKHGKKTIILARFVPIVRTFAPIVAGVGNMKYKVFITYNVIGAFLWTWTMLWLGYGLGRIIPNPDRYVLPIIILIVLVSAAPVVKEIIKQGINKLKS